MQNNPSFLFVCLGNICRSPMAEGALRKRAEDAGLELRIDSAGTAGWHEGGRIDNRSVSEAARHGVDLSSIRARQIHEEDFYRFDLIIAMDWNNYAELNSLKPDDSSAHLIAGLDLVEERRGDEVSDPYYGNEDNFRACWDDCDAIANAIIEKLKNGEPVAPERAGH